MTREVAGPTTFEMWQASYRVYRTALIMLETVPLAHLNAYEAHIEKLVRNFPGCWHLICQADDRGRSEHLTRLKLRATMAGGVGSDAPVGFDADKPWATLMRALVDDDRYWNEQVILPGTAWMAQGSRGVPDTPGGENLSAGHERSARSRACRSEGSDKPSRSSQRREARKRKRQSWAEDVGKNANGNRNSGKGKGGKGSGKNSGSPRCFAWNNGNGPCADVPPRGACLAPVKREHKCTTCGSPGHPSKNCPNKKS